MVGIAGAALFYVAHLPLPFVLGPMYACLLANLVYPHLSGPSWIRPPVVAVIGVMLGSAFKPELLDAFYLWTIPLAGLLTAVGITVFVNYIFYRWIAGFEKTTAFFSSTPGGLVEMVLLGGQYGGKETDIALAHSSRILLVVMLLPWVIRYVLGIPFSGRTVTGPPLTDLTPWIFLLMLACAVTGALVGKILRFPAYAFVGPMIVSAIIHLTGASDFRVPAEFVIAAQVLLGISVGVGFLGVPPRMVGRAMMFGLGASFIMIVIALAIAWIISAIAPFDISSLLLAYAPGGFPEMSLIAFALGVDVALVAALHVIRIAIVLLFVPFIYKSFIAGK